MDYKNALQKYCQKHGYALPKYTTVRVTGSPDHAPLFQSTVRIEGNQEQTKEKAEMSADAGVSD